MERATRLFLLSLALALLGVVPAFAQSVSGGFHVVTDDGTRNIEFNAKLHPNGSASGDLKFTGPLAIPDQDVDGDATGDTVGDATTVSLKVDIDCVRVNGNRAAVAGSVRTSNVDGYVGRRIILTVEDGGEGKNAEPDRYTWGQYRSTAATWVASDAELEVDPGVGLVWFVSDFEREDDTPVSSAAPVGIDCQSFSLGSYALEDLPEGSGNIQVKP
jgi:hypothetical protein